MSQNKNDRSRDINVGQYLVAGAAIGVIVFALTSAAVWIGIGAALGVFIAGVWGAIRRRTGDTRGENGRDD